ncbi:MAG TPA: GNAT family N-acetyltransferase [Bryobacteraceae bacterium]|nr:GNAT family N-acetyltransferase [Bryobacteraceae bacterium]
MATQRVRRFVSEDIPQVAELHRRLYRESEQPSPALERSYRGFFQDVYLNNPWYSETLGPLACEDGEGKIIGFLGVMPRPMRINGRPIQAAVSSMFMVDPNHRVGLAAVQLLKAFLAGPQDLSYADESTGPSRKLWERLGGVTSMLNSMHWTRPLRPAGLLNFQLGQRNSLRALARMSAPLCWAADAAISRLKSSPFFCAPPKLAGENADVNTLIECTGRLYDSQALRPEYDEQSLRWLLDLASHGDDLEKVVVRNSAGSVVGWYVYCISRDRIAELLQIGAKPNFTKDVLDHLLSHAEHHGAVAVTGRVDPRYLEDLGSSCMMRPRYWMLVHSRHPQLLNMIDRGEPYLTRLEGEWCMQFHISRYQGANAERRALVTPLPVLPDSSITVEARRGGAEIVDALADEWRQLCDQDPGKEPFYRPEWVAASIRAFSLQEEAVVVTARAGGVLKAVLPLMETRTLLCGVPVTKLRGAANAHSCRFDLVRCAGIEGDAAVRALWRYLRDLPGWDLIELPYVLEGAALEGLAAAARQDGFPVGLKESMRSQYLPLSWPGEDQDPLLYQSTANFRANVRRKERQVKASGILTLRCVDKADPVALQTFYDLESSGWKGRQGTAIVCENETRQFYDEIARQGERFGYLRLYFLDLDGHTIAAQFGIEHGGRYFMPKLAFDENFRKYGPGHLLIHAIMRNCVERGLTEYDFTGPSAEYKAKWASSTRLHSTLTIFRKGFLGSSLHAAKFKVEAGVKDMLRPLFSAT